MVLTSKQLKQLLDALIDGYRSYGELERLARFELGHRLREISPPDPLPDVGLRLLDRLEADGQVAMLIDALRRERPNNPKIAAFLRLWDALAKNAIPDAVLEGMVRKNQRFLKPRQWRNQQESLERRVCRVELNDEAVGTGFLVGRDVVLTNHHVVSQAIASGRSDGYQCRFDYYEGIAGEGIAVPFHATDWKLAYSPIHPADYKPLPKDPEPGVDHLDYAFVVLSRPIGDDLDEEQRPRGVVEVPAEVDFAGVQVLAILQHPAGGPLALALDTTPGCEVNPQSTRVRYQTNTLRGSSGSPCFDADWRLVALHHSKDPSGKLTPDYNEGIPIATIRGSLPAEKKQRIGW